MESENELKELEEEIKDFESVNVSLHHLREWYDPDEYVNQLNAGYFGVDEPFDRRGYRRLGEIREGLESLSFGRIATRFGAVYEQKKPFKSLKNVPAAEAISLIRELPSRYYRCQTYQVEDPFKFFKEFRLYLSKEYKGYSIHLQGLKQIRNKTLRNLAGGIMKRERLLAFLLS